MMNNLDVEIIVNTNNLFVQINVEEDVIHQ